MKIYKELNDGSKIVEYEDSLAAAVAKMWNLSGEGWGGELDVRTEEQVRSEVESGAYFNVYIAMKDGEAIGYCSYNRYHKDEDSAYVHVLNVRPDYHGKKIGKELVLMCVNETIARGLPRLDIHTWPGNTKAVPLYKKCGFLWEDRTDSTHLCNYIPSIIKNELFAEFFKKADWYGDSVRKIEIAPDGVKDASKFEYAYYEWEKDGEYLKIGYEKTGRSVRYAETDDYIIELTADNHEPAFGFKYNAAFKIINKSGKTLDVGVKGKNDGVIGFDCEFSQKVTGEAVFEKQFFVNAITEPQDTWRMHPRVLADVVVNGKRAEFGLGIEPKFPLSPSLVEKRHISTPGRAYDMYINISNSLPDDAEVKFILPENDLIKFDKTDHILQLKKGMDSVINIRAKTLRNGYMALPVTYEIVTEGGDFFSFTRPLHIVNQGTDGTFYFETDSEYGAANGTWRLTMKKQDSRVDYRRVVKPGGHAAFEISRLGKPYDDEFNLMKPSDVRFFVDADYITFEADFASKKFGGAVLTEIYEMNSSGVLKRRHRLINLGDAARELSIKTEFWTGIGRRPVLHYDGDFHEVADDFNYGFSNLPEDLIDENWIFENDPKNPQGI